jgi:WD40 repeat protein
VKDFKLTNFFFLHQTQQKQQNHSKMAFQKRITPYEINLLATAYSFELPSPITSFDFSPQGDFVASTAERLVHYTNIERDRQPRPHSIRMTSHGSEIARMEGNFIIHSTTKANDSIMCLDKVQKKYSRKFTGHKNRVSTIALSPDSVTMLSGSEDNTIRLWDRRLNESCNFIDTLATPFVDFHPTGAIFSVANENFVIIYDIRNMNNALSGIKLEENEISGIKHSDDGNSLLVTTMKPKIIQIDPRTNLEVRIMEDFRNNGEAIEASFTSFSGFIASGSSDGFVNVWNSQTGVKVAKLQAEILNTTVKFIKFNPKMMLMATGAGRTFRFWIESKIMLGEPRDCKSG